MATTPLADAKDRASAVVERDLNVLIDAGAGTGKTTILVRRLVNMVAPEDDGRAIAIGRIAAVTFTRRAAGELRLRIRERLLEVLGESAGLTPLRRDRLHDALAGIDTAYVGTIHGFADRLLRLRPVEAGLSPAYDIVEDDGELVHETFVSLLHAVETGTLAAQLAGSAAVAHAAEATEIVLTALAAGIRPESEELDYFTKHGLDGLIRGFIQHREAPPGPKAVVAADLHAFRERAREFIDLVASIGSDSPGARWFRWMADILAEACAEDDPRRVYQLVMGRQLRGPVDPTKKRGFADDEQAFRVWKAFLGDESRKPLRDGSLRDELTAPLRRWMGSLLVGLFPVVVELYERVKQRHRVLDQVDLLIKLRDLLARDLKVRAGYQALFDHIFVDEFQDTDPLQAEIILFLCEREPRAAQWRDVCLADGKLTIVGDPKQSIYRFRRADIATYDEVRRLVAASPHLNVRLSANFRSAAPLVAWFNGRFERLLGPPPAGAPFDPSTGAVFHQPLDHYRQSDIVRGAHVHIVPFERTDDARADAYRELEAEVVGRYIRWLVEVRRYAIYDPVTEQSRAVGYGDIAILAITTPTLSPLFGELDRMDVPYVARGGRLFLRDQLHRQFILGLRAIADRDDGVAMAALLRPPFFALDLVDIVLERAAGEETRSPEVDRVRAAMELVLDLRRRRFQRSPGATARDLLERTAFARVVALGRNGLQRLHNLREICLVLEQTAAVEGLDYDAVTARLREWVADPVQLDPPRPVGDSAVQIMTVHQAKGLEFPVVILWDSRCPFDTRESQQPWRMDRNGRGWAVTLQDLKWEEPAGLELAASEKAYADAERKRVVYVAATRARDLFVLPKGAGAKPDRHVPAHLIADGDPALVEELEAYIMGKGAAWADAVSLPTLPVPRVESALEQDVAARWAAATDVVGMPRFQPIAVSGEAAVTVRETDEDPTTPDPKRAGRYGAIFGETVHRAIGIVLREPAVSPGEAVYRAAGQVGLDHHRDEAAADVGRAVDVLRREGLLCAPGPELRLEYPIAGAGQGGKLLVGYIDLVVATADGLHVLDFKTDQPPNGPVRRVYPHYGAQVEHYARLLGTAGVSASRTLRAGLLFTGDGSIRWL